VRVANSIITGGAYGIFAFVDDGSAFVAVDRTLISDHLYGITANTNTGATGDVEIVASNNVLTNNDTAVNVQASGAGTSTTLVLDGNVITKSGSAIRNQFGSGTATVYSRGNNTLRFNTANQVPAAHVQAMGGI
jgi:hypothetical protein